MVTVEIFVHVRLTDPAVLPANARVICTAVERFSGFTRMKWLELTPTIVIVEVIPKYPVELKFGVASEDRCRIIPANGAVLPTWSTAPVLRVRFAAAIEAPVIVTPVLVKTTGWFALEPMVIVPVPFEASMIPLFDSSPHGRMRGAFAELVGLSSIPLSCSTPAINAPLWCVYPIGLVLRYCMGMMCCAP